MNYRETMDYIEAATSRGIMPGLSRIMCLVDELGHPENQCNVIHVAGTNGKGSVCSYIASILQEAGYSVGRYVSPTLYGYRERIQINSKWIAKDELAEYMSIVREADERMQEKYHMEGASAFELETALGFLYFNAKKCDFIVLEVGMGGRQDATNVVEHPVISVITSIAMDHMHFLGDSIEDIAFEKGGIIKESRPVIIGADNKDAERVLVDICEKMHSEYHIVQEADVHISSADLEEGQIFDLLDYKRLKTHMLGAYQPDNAAIAVAVINRLMHMGRQDFTAPVSGMPSDRIDENIIRRGVEHAKWPGRFEIVHHDPLVIVDGAHNPEGARALCKSAHQYLEGREIIPVMGVFADKDYNQMLEIVSELSELLIAFKPKNVRGLEAIELTEQATVYFPHVVAASSQSRAIQKALAISKKDDVILCFGSLSTVSDLRRIIGRITYDKY